MRREDDHYAWALSTARALRVGDAALLDLSEVADELEEMGKADARELQSRITRTLEPLLKLKLLTGIVREYNERGWHAAIRRQRAEVGSLLEHNPSLRAKITEALIGKCYRNAASIVAAEFDVMSPDKCPFSIEEVAPCR